MGLCVHRRPLKDLCQGRGWQPAWNLRMCVFGVYAQERERERHLGGMDEEGEGRRILALVNIPPRVPHFLGIGLTGSYKPSFTALLCSRTASFQRAVV